MRWLLIGLVVSMASPAVAAIFEVDLYESGDALITRDTQQDIDWLDVTLTTGLGGVPAVVAGAGGWVDEGWRLATTSELCSFLIRASGHALTCPGQTYEQGSFGQPVLDLLGVTVSREQPYGIGTLYSDQIWASFDDGDPSDGPGGLELSVDTHSDSWVQTFIETRDDRSYSSVLLVRAIPEPSTGTVCGLGLAVLAGCRRAASRVA
jgi:hypothetical protein